MKKGIIAGAIAVVAIAAIVGVVVANNRNNNAKPATSSANNSASDNSNAAEDTPATANPGSGGLDPGAGESGPIETTSVNIKGFAFSPTDITVKKGATVTWTNNDDVSHTVTGDQNGGPDSELFAPGKTYSFTFNTVGTFGYHCAPHPQMTGKVVVVE